MAPGSDGGDVQVVCVAGPSGAGKTTLIERLLPRLAEGRDGDGRGRVATAKSIHHDVEVDEPGKDTHRHREAGAEATVGVTPSRTFGFVEAGKSKAADGTGGHEEVATLEPVLDGYADFGVDYALVEGFSSSSLPTVVVGGEEVDGDSDEGGGNGGSEDGDGVGEPVVARVDGGETADLQTVIDAVHGLRGYETATSVLEREHGYEPGSTVAVASVEANGLASAMDWTHGRVDGAVGSIPDDLRDRASVERVAVDVRPPVAPGGTAAVHVAVSAPDLDRAYAASAEAGDRLSASTGADGSVEYRLRQPLG